MLKNLFFSVKKFTKTKVTNKLALVVFVFVIVSVSIMVFAPTVAKADFMDGVTNILAYILEIFLGFIGSLISLVLSVLINIAQFNEFTSSPAVVTGWGLVRDMCNMFFIVLLLVISVGTVLGIQSYSYKNFLKKIIIMAILINFSKTIAGFLIDVSQVIMLTFVAAFKDTISVGFTEAFGVNKLKSLATSMDASGEIEQDNFALLLGMILGLVIAVILLLVLVSVVVMLAYRIVILWILVVLSPFAYLASAMPGSLSSQAKQWWSQFTEQLIVGPAIAFFLWLALSVVSTTGGKFTTEEGSVNPESIIAGQLASAPFLLNYLLGIMLLVVGMKMAQQMGGKSGAAMGKAFDSAKKYGTKAVKGVGKLAGKGAGIALGAGVMGLAEKFGAKEGSILHLAAARAMDKKKARKDARENFGRNVLKKIGVGDNAMESLATRGKKKKQNKIDEVVNNAAGLARQQWTGDQKVHDKDGNFVPSEVLRESYAEEKNVEITEKNRVIDEKYDKEVSDKKDEIATKVKSEANEEWTKNKDSQLRMFGINNGGKKVDDLSEQDIKRAENEFKEKYETDNLQSRIDGAVNNIVKDKKQVSYDTTNTKSMLSLGEKYTEEQAEVVRKREEKDYKVSGLSKLNPMHIAYDVAKKETKDHQDAIHKGEVFAKEPDRFEAGDVEDSIGNIKGKATKAIFKNMKTEQVGNLHKHLVSKVSDAENKDERDKANKKLTAFSKASRFLHEDKDVDNAASKYYADNLINKTVVVGSGNYTKSEDIKNVEIKKSNKDWMTDADISEEQIINTGYELENEISNLKSSDLVTDASGEVGWQVDQDATKINESNNIVLRKGTESQEVTRDEFVGQNANELSEHFYESDRYKRLQSDQGENYVLSQEQYKEYSSIQKSSQEGVTTGSLSRGGDTVAVGFDELDAELETPLVGEQRKAGLFVKGDEAVRAAGGLQTMLQKQVDDLQGAETEDDIRKQLTSFGRGDAAAKADLPKLRELKEETIGQGQAAMKNLDNTDKIKRDGLVLLNKTRGGRAAKELLRHEQSHKLLSQIDPKGDIQEKIWKDMGSEEQAKALATVRDSHSDPDMPEQEARKEYIADAFANEHRPGGPKDDEPRLSEASLGRLRTEDKREVKEQNVKSKFAAKLETWRMTKDGKKERKVGQDLRASAKKESAPFAASRVRGQVDEKTSSTPPQPNENIQKALAPMQQIIDENINDPQEAIDLLRQVQGNINLPDFGDMILPSGMNQADLVRAINGLIKELQNQRGESYEDTEASGQGVLSKVTNLMKSTLGLSADEDNEDEDNEDEDNTETKNSTSDTGQAVKFDKKSDTVSKFKLARGGNLDGQKVGFRKSVLTAKTGKVSEKLSTKGSVKPGAKPAVQEKIPQTTIQTARVDSESSQTRLAAIDKERADITKQLEANEKDNTITSNQKQVNRERFEKESVDLDTQAQAITGSVGAETKTKVEVLPAVQEKAQQVQSVLEDKSSNRGDVINNLQTLQTELNNNLDAKGDSGDMKQLITAVNDLVSTLQNQSGEAVSDSTRQTANNTLQPLLKIDKVDATKKKVAKGGIGALKKETKTNSFLNKPLSMRQFLMMKKWFQQQGDKIGKLGAEQSATSNQMNKKISNLNERVNSINTQGGGDVDMQVLLKEQGFTSDEIEQIVDNYTSQQSNNE